MIQVNSKENCCGCEACVQRCPKSCIELRFDEQGFRYPVVDTDTCVDCKLCETVCPVLNQSGKREPLTIYGAYNTNEEVRLKSSSGGVFYVLAKYVIEQGGVVFGARFNKQWEVEHCAVENLERLGQLMGSKYVQSHIGETYKQTEVLLRKGFLVLFSGTPCQIAALKRYLRKDYQNLIAVDFVCHGVPSPGVWEKYKKQAVGNGKIQDIAFRDKSQGWEKYSFKMKLNFPQAKNTVEKNESTRKNLYMRAFLTDLILRPSCYHCPAREFKSGSDITLADLWGVWKTLPDFNDDKGCSCVAINTERGRALVDKISSELSYKEISYKSAFVDYNMSATKNPHINPKSEQFFSQYNDTPLSILIPMLTKDSMKVRLSMCVRGILDKVGLLKIIRRY